MGNDKVGFTACTLSQFELKAVGQTSVANQVLKAAAVTHSSVGINLIREDVAGRQARELRSPNDDAPHLANLLQGSRYTIKTWPRILRRS